jgi:hypothetical protein
VALFKEKMIMRSNCIGSKSYTLLASGLIAIVSCSSAVALDSVKNQSSVVETTTTREDPTIIQHIESKMEPTVVQSREVKDSDTGEKQKVVEPIIMESREKVLDTTIIQPEVTETKRTTQQVTQSQVVQPKAVVHKSYAVTRRPRKYVARRRAHAGAKIAHRTRTNHAAVSSVNEVVQTTEVTRQPMVRQTIIPGTDNDKAPEPQVIQKIETK